MRTVVMSGSGGPEVLGIGVRPTPEPGPGDLLVRVEAAGVNRPDLMQRQGKYPPPPGASDILGLELAGTVERVGANVSRWKPGDRVCALVAGGAYAEYCVVPEPQALAIPSGLDPVHAAAIPETYFTVWTNLFERGRLREGERVLVHGGTSGIGTTAIQLGRAFGARVLATAGSDDKCAACDRLGAEAINYRRTNFVEAVRDLTGGAGVDVILDIVGGPDLPSFLDRLADNGRLVAVGIVAGHPPADFGMSLLRSFQRSRSFATFSLNTVPVTERNQIRADLLAAAARGELHAVVHDVLPLVKAADAHRRMDSGEVFGRIVLTPPEG